MNISYIDILKGPLPDFGPFIEQQFADQSERGVSRGIKRFVNSLSIKKLYQAANQIDDYKREHKENNPVQIIEALREGLRVKISLRGLFILSKHPSLDKMNRYALKEAIQGGSKKNYTQIVNQIKLHPKYLGKVSKILKKSKRESFDKACEFCYILALELSKEEKSFDSALKILSDFNHLETSKKVYDYYAVKCLVTKDLHPFKEKLEKAYPEWAFKRSEKKELKYEGRIHWILASTLALSLVGFALSFFLGAFILLSGSAFALYVQN